MKLILITPPTYFVEEDKKLVKKRKTESKGKSIKSGFRKTKSIINNEMIWQTRIVRRGEPLRSP